VEIRSATDAYLTGVELFARRKLLYRKEIGVLVDLAESASLQTLFDELIFLAKFASSASNILTRSGMHGDETAKLSSEFAESLRKVSSVLELLVANAPADVAGGCRRSFLDLSPESMNRLMALLYELSWIKNYSLDGHPPPFSSSPAR